MGGMTHCPDLISQTLQIKATCFGPGSRKPSPEQTEHQATGRKTNRGRHQLHLLLLGPAPGPPSPWGDRAAPNRVGGKERGASGSWGGVARAQPTTSARCRTAMLAWSATPDTHNSSGKDSVLR